MADYSIHTDLRYAPLELIDTGSLAGDCSAQWWNQSLCKVNGCLIRLGVFLGEFHWHKHDQENEYFQVLEGELLVDLEGRSLSLHPGHAVLVPRTTVHRTRALIRTVVLMVEGDSVIPTGD